MWLKMSHKSEPLIFAAVEVLMSEVCGSHMCISLFANRVYVFCESCICVLRIVCIVYLKK